jgi:hypothetical protein
MKEFVLVDDSVEEEPLEKLPSYKEPGRLLFHFDPTEDFFGDRYSIIDHEGSTFWLVESSFADYWLDRTMDLELEGFYVLEGITGYGWTDYWGEYDEEWIFQICRRASDEEIRTEALV